MRTHLSLQPHEIKGREWRAICGLKGMPRFGALRNVLLLAAALVAMSACHSSPVVTQTVATKNSPLPFSEKPSTSRTPKVPTEVSVPAGTPISVRLQEPLSSETARAGQTFSAVLDESLVAHGVTVLPQGAAVTGSVLAVRRSGTMRSGGVLQIALNAVQSDGKRVPIQTSSVIAGGNSPLRLPQSDAAPYMQGKRVAVGAQRRLTFRLRQPASIPAVSAERTPGS